MKRSYLALICALALLAGAGCSSQPKVSPAPSSTVRPSETPVHSEIPSATPMPDETDNYHAGGDGQVDLDGDGKTNDERGVADDIKDAVDGAGKAVEDAVKGAGDLAEDAVDGAGRAIEKAGDTLTGHS